MVQQFESRYEIKYWDDLSGVKLEEMAEIYKHQLYTKVPIAQCIERTGAKPIGVRWVDINKGDKVHP